MDLRFVGSGEEGFDIAVVELDGAGDMRSLVGVGVADIDKHGGVFCEFFFYVSDPTDSDNDDGGKAILASDGSFSLTSARNKSVTGQVNDNGTMKQVALTDFETYFEENIDAALKATIDWPREE